MPAHLRKAMGVVANITDNQIHHGDLADGYRQDHRLPPQGNINSIDIRCRSGGITLTDIPEVVRPQVRLTAVALDITALYG